MAFINRALPADDDTRRFHLDLGDARPGQVKFIFRNNSPQDYAITHVYFDEGEMVVIDLLKRPVPGTGITARGLAATGSPGSVRTADRESPQARDLAVTFDLHDGIGMADLVFALHEQRLKISLKAMRLGSETGVIFDSVPVLTLNPPQRRP
jgi:hypothetical protein